MCASRPRLPGRRARAQAQAGLWAGHRVTANGDDATAAPPSHAILGHSKDWLPQPVTCGTVHGSRQTSPTHTPTGTFGAQPSPAAGQGEGPQAHPQSCAPPITPLVLPPAPPSQGPAPLQSLAPPPPIPGPVPAPPRPVPAEAGSEKPWEKQL